MTAGVAGVTRTHPIAKLQDSAADVLTHAVAWSPDGSAIAFHDGYWLDLPTLSLVAPDGSHRRDLVTTTASFAWSPTGDALAFTNRGISIVPARGGTLRHLVATPQGTSVDHLSWLPDGRSIIFQSGGLDVVDLCRVSVDGTALTYLADCVPAHQGHDVSKDGQAVVFVQSVGADCEHSDTRRIAVLRLANGTVSSIVEPGWSPQWLGS
jgi:Tol biopolymer transport system component